MTVTNPMNDTYDTTLTRLAHLRRLRRLRQNYYTAMKDLHAAPPRRSKPDTRDPLLRRLLQMSIRKPAA